MAAEEPKENHRPPVPPFDQDAAVRKVRLAEDAWNTRDPEKVASGYTPDSLWRNRTHRFSKTTPKNFE